MFLAFLIKHICLLAFYFAYASIMVVELTNYSMLVYFTVLISYSFSYAIRFNEKYTKYKYIPILGALISILFTRTIAEIVAVTIPYMYIILLAVKDKYCFNYYSFKDRFINCIFGIAPLLLFVFILKIYELFKDTSLKYVIVFLISGLYLLRTLRHTEEVIKSKKFVIMNISVIILMIIACIIFSSDIIVNAIIYSVKSLYYNIISPMFMQVLYFVFWLFNKVLPTTEEKERKIILESFDSKQGVGQIIRQDNFVNDKLFIIVYIFTIMLFLFIVSIIIIRFLSKRKRKEYIDAEGVKSYRRFVDVNKKINKKGNRIYDKGISQIRYWYKKFLELCRRKEMSIFIYDNSKTIYEKSSEIFKNQEDDLKSMQEIYRKARYSKDDVINQDIKKIKGVYKNLEKEK